MKRGALWSFAATTVGALGTLLVTPLLIRTLGTAEFGAYVLILTATSYATFLDLGLPWAATRSFADDLARGHREVLASRLATAAILLFVTSCAAGAAAVAVVPWIVEMAGGSPAGVPVAVTLAAASVCVAFQTGLFQALLRAAQRFDDVGRAAFATSVIVPLGSYLAVRFQPDLVLLMAVNLVANLTALLLLVRAAARRLPLRLRDARWDVDRLREMATFSGWSSISRLVTVVMLHCDRLFVALAGSVTGLTYYAIPAQLASRINLLGEISTTVFFAKTSWLRAGGRLDDLRRQHATMRRLLVWVTAALAVPLITFGPVFLEVWIGPDMRSSGAPVLLMLVLGYATISVTAIDAALVEGCGRPDLTAKASSFWAWCALGVGVGLHPWLSSAAIGAAVAIWLIGLGVTNAILRRRVLGPGSGSVTGMLAGVAGAYGLSRVVEAAVGDAIVDLVTVVLAMLASGATVLLWGLFAILHRDDRRMLLDLFGTSRMAFASAPAGPRA